MITPAALPGAMTTPTLHIKTDFAPLANGCHHVVHSEIGGEEVSWNETRKASMETGFTDTTLTCLPLPTPSEGHVTRLPTPISGIAYPWTDSNCLSSDSLRVTGRYSDWPKPLPPPSPSPLPPTQAMHPHQISSSLDRATHERYQAPSPHEDLDDVSCTDDLVDEFSALSTHATESPAAGRQHEYPPTPARSTKDGDQDDSQNDSGTDSIFTVVSPACGQIFRYREIVELGTGSFSRVVLAKCEQEYRDPSMQHAARPITPPSHEKDDTGLVAMKIVNIAAAGGGDAERIRESLKREVKLLKSLRHPSIVRMKAYNLSDVQKKAFLALEYSPGSDLQRFACSSKHLLTPAVVKRIFAELVNALVYLHHNWVVHRDVKLENVLLNLTAQEIEHISAEDGWSSYLRPVVTLTDFGLSRRLPSPPGSHRLRTRCGSEDYAAPEIIMGQPYDGRAVDAWSLGVLLYALIENRLPFDPLPHQPGQARSRARTPHKIALCEYEWVRYGNDGQWDGAKGAAFTDAATIVERLLKRDGRRMGLDAVLATDWVQASLPCSMKV